MLKFWSTFNDQTTPRSGATQEANPFDSNTSFHHHLLAAGIPSSPGSFPDLSADLTPLGPMLTPPTASFAPPTTSLSINPPDFNIMQPPKPKNKSPSPQTAGPSKGQIHVKIIQARGLNVPSANARPYIVVQFEQNESVSRDPTDEFEKDFKDFSQTLSRNHSSNALVALNVIGSKASIDITKRNCSATQITKHFAPSSPTSIFPLKSPTTASGLFGSSVRSAHNPVWKHEVSLYVRNILVFSISNNFFWGAATLHRTNLH
jgi:hypothetical protein